MARTLPNMARALPNMARALPNMAPPQVRFGESGWKDRYYQHKFHMGAADVDARRYVAQEYVHGLCWVLMYYYQGVQAAAAAPPLHSRAPSQL